MFDLTQGRVGATLAKMTMFTTMGMVSILGFALADAYYVGILGKNYLASISYCVPILLFTSGIGVGIGIGAEAILARLVGEGETQKTKEFATNAMVFATVVSILFGILGYAIIDEIPVWLETDPALYPLMQQYLVIWFVGIPPLVACLVAGSLARALGDAQTPAIVMVVTSLMNAALDPILIFGIEGWVPAMGFEGAAWATLFSRCVAGVWSVLLLIFRYELLADRIPPLAQFWHESKEICRLGFPATMVQLLFPMGQACLLKLLAVFPVAVVAAFGMAMQVEAFGFIVLMSLGIILGPFVGQNVGANSIGRVLRSVDLCLAFNLFNGTALAVVFWLFGKPILSCFHDDPEVIEHMVMIMRWLSLSWILEGVRLLAAPVFTNLGSSVPPMVIVTIRFFVVALPLAWFFRTSWGFDGVVFSLALGNVVAGIISYIWLKKVLPESRT